MSSTETSSQSATTGSVKPPALVLLVALSAVGPLAINIFQPSIGAISNSFSIPSSDVQWALTVYLAGLMVGQVIYGPLSDRFGRRPLLFAGLLGFVLSNIFLALAPTFGFVLLGRALQAFTGCCGIVLTRAIVRDCYDSESSASAYGYITTAMVAVPAFAPSIGYGLETLGGWRLSFWFLAAFGAFVLLVSVLRVPETNTRPLSRLNLYDYFDGSKRLLKDRAFMAYTGVVGFGTASFFCFLNGAPYATVEVLGGTGLDYSLYFLILSAGYMGGNFVAGRYSKALGLPKMMKIGQAIGLLGSVIFLLNIVDASMLMIFVPASIIAFGGGLYNPASMAGALAIRPDIAGTASSLIGVLSMVVALILSSLVNQFLAPDLVGFTLIYVGCSFGAALCAWVALVDAPLKDLEATA